MTVLVTKWFGVFLVDEKTNRIVNKILMPSDPDETAGKLADIQKGSILPEERRITEGIAKLYVSDRRQSELGKPMLYDSSFIKPETFGFTDDTMHQVMLRLGKLRTSEPIARDNNLVQAIRNLDDTIETANLLNERLHEWYGMHFPELADMAKDRRYAQLISEHGSREGVLEFLESDMQSIGSDFEPDDMAAVMDLATMLCKIYDDKERIEAYIASIVTETCPNMCALLGGPISARLISLAGGLKRLSSLPSSTLQLLGAEKAMFRHLKTGKRPPKHGVLYQCPDVHRAPYWQRGNIARALAGKALIAAKVDEYHGEFIGDKLKEEFDIRVADIKRRYPDPPKKTSEKNKGNRKRRNKPRL